VVHPPLGVALTRAGVELVVWGPRYRPTAAALELAASDPVRSVNDNSLVIELRAHGRSIMFAGDLEEEGEALVVAAGLRRVDVVKVAHHGSRTSSSPAFVAAAAPSLAIISCGRGNPFGFPSPEVIARWSAVGATIARTDLDGAVQVTIGLTGALMVD
jgi:competence protein ComEC